MTASAFDIAASGMAAHRAELDLIAQNIAHAGMRNADGTPYRAQTAILEPARPSFGDVLANADEGGVAEPLIAFDASDAIEEDDAPPGGVRLAGIVDEGPPSIGQTASRAGSMPGFTDDVDPIEQMVALVAAGRAYDGDVAALQAAKQMDVEAISVDQP